MYVCAGDRGHVIERRHNSKKNESEQHQEFINLDEGGLSSGLGGMAT